MAGQREDGRTYNQGIDEGGKAIIAGAAELRQVKGSPLLLQRPRLKGARYRCSLGSLWFGVGVMAETTGRTLVPFLTLQKG